MFFLEQFGIRLATFEPEDDAPEEPVPPEVKDKPKERISPLGYVIDDNAKTADFIGTRIFVQVNSDPDDPSSSWEDVQKDDDGDYIVNLEIESETLLAQPIYFNFKGDVNLIPKAVRSIDNDNDLVIDVSELVKLHALKEVFTLLHVPDNVDPSWYYGKYHWNGKDKAQICIQGTWSYVHLPLNSSFEEGYYSF